MCGVTEQESAVQSRMKSMLSKMKEGVSYSQGVIDVSGTTDAQAFAKLLLENKIEFDGTGQQQVRLTTTKNKTL